MSQILITINDAYPENRREQAYLRICAVYQQTLGGDFAWLAARYSECPSALEQGYLGWCTAGQLYPQIRALLPTLLPQQVSEPVETELGFHLIKYHRIREARIITFAEALPYLEEKHYTRARAYVQKQWVRQLMQNP
jgi:parvulin-like peptidyl-prolyl isomerase